MSVDTQDLREQAASLLKRADLLDSGEPLCNHHWSGDPGWECYCTGCDTWLLEVRDECYIPFLKDAYCYDCRKKLKKKEKRHSKV